MLSRTFLVSRGFGTYMPRFGSVQPVFRILECKYGVNNSTFKNPPKANSLSRKKKVKPQKVVPTVEDLIKQGIVKSGSSIDQPKLKTKTKSKSSSSKNKSSEEIEEEVEDDPFINGNVQMIGRCIKFVAPGKRYNEWIMNNMDLLSQFDALPTPKLRYLVAKTAKELFGYEKLRPLQVEAVMELLRPSKLPCHVIILSGTGSGKSLIYWLSSVLQEFSVNSKPKLSVVISPLVSLLNDQFVQLEPSGIPTAIYYGKVTAPARKTLFTRMIFWCTY